MIRQYLQHNYKATNIWAGFVDVITFTLFTVLLIFVISFIRYQYLGYIIGKGEKDIQTIMDMFKDEDYTFINGKIIIQDKVLFETNEAELKKDGKIKLKRIGEKLKKYLFDEPERLLKFSVIVEGHTDTRGKNNYNLNLSFKRAKAVTDYWEKEIEFGTSLNQNLDLLPAGYGETRLFVKTTDNVDEPQNRRIEIRLVPKFNAMLEGWYSEQIKNNRQKDIKKVTQFGIQ